MAVTYITYSATVRVHNNFSPSSAADIINSGSATIQAGTGYPVAVTLPACLFSRQGYTFKGYNGNPSASAPSSQPGDNIYFTFTESGSQLYDIYCIWAKNPYTVTYDANGGENAPAVQSYPADTSVTLSDAVPARTGYRFLGWSQSADATTASYVAGSTQTFSGNVTLYAVWTLLTYTISFNANGGENAPAAQTKTYGEDLTLTSSEPTREGYEFVGWAASNTAATADYEPGGTYSGNSNATLFAVWHVVTETHTLTYNANGGQDAPEAQTQTYSVEDQSSFTVTNDEPTREGYAFKGWSETSGGTVDYEAGDTISASADKTIYAVWEKVQFTLTYNANGGSNAPASQMKQKGIALIITDSVPSKQSSVFMGWATSAEATEAEYHGGDSFTIDADTVLYAVWGTHSIMSVYVIQDGEPVECNAYVVVSGEPVLCDVYVGGE